MNSGMGSRHGVSLWNQSAWFEVDLLKQPEFVLLEMQRNCFNIRLVHSLGTTRVFEGARIDQATRLTLTL